MKRSTKLWLALGAAAVVSTIPAAVLLHGFRMEHEDYVRGRLEIKLDCEDIELTKTSKDWWGETYRYSCAQTRVEKRNATRPRCTGTVRVEHHYRDAAYSWQDAEICR